jgi:hypothetical protein
MNARRTGAVSAAALSGLVLTLGLAQVVAPEWVKRVGLDVWNMPGLRADARASAKEAAELRARQEKLGQEIELSEHVAARLADGSLTLAEATDELEPILRDRPGFDAIRVAKYEAPTFRHGVARYAIMKVHALLARDPARRAAVSARLEAEYAALGG